MKTIMKKLQKLLLNLPRFLGVETISFASVIERINRKILRNVHFKNTYDFEIFHIPPFLFALNNYK